MKKIGINICDKTEGTTLLQSPTVF